MARLSNTAAALMMITGAAIVSSTIGCANVTDEDASSAPLVSQSLTFNGAFNPRPVAMNFKQKMMSLLFPTAVAETPTALTDKNGLSVNLSSAWIALKKVQFKTDETAGASESEEAETEFAGPYAVDLLASSPLPVATQELPALPYHRIKMVLHKDGPLPAGAPAQLNGQSIYLAGTVGAHQVSFASDDGVDFTISGPNPVLPESGKDLLVVFRFADLFSKIDLSAISADTAVNASNRVSAPGACPQIDASANDLYTCFRKGMEAMAEFGKDNGDHDLDDADDDSVK